MNNMQRDIFMLAMVGYAEASDQGQAGLRAQMHSAVNRHHAVDEHGKPRWYTRKTIAATLLVPFAYSAENTKDPNRVRAMETDMDDVIMQVCFSEALLAVSGTSPDPTDGATHYYAVGSEPPDWAEPDTGAIYTCQVGAHKFYKNVA